MAEPAGSVYLASGAPHYHHIWLSWGPHVLRVDARMPAPLARDCVLAPVLPGQTLLCAFPVESKSWGPPRPPYCPGPSQSRDRHEGDDAADSSSALGCHPVLLGCPLRLCCVPDARWLAPGYWLWLASGLHSMCLCLAPRGWGANTVAASLSKRALPVPPGVAPQPCAEQCPSWGWACAVPKGPPYPAPDQKIQCTEQINAGYPFAEQGAKGLRILL